MKFFDLTSSTAPDGAKVLDVNIFGDIDPGFFGDGVASREIAEQLAAHPDAKRITSHINSFGGDLFAGLAIYNLLQGHPAEVTSIVEGIAASAASVIAMAGKTVIARGGMLMMHAPIAGVVGNAGELRATADALDKARDSLVAVYQAKSGKKPAELKAMLATDTWFTAEEAKAAGFAAEIADKPVKAKASAGAVILNSVSFARSRVPAPILAMATEEPLAAPTEIAPPETAPDADPAASPPAPAPAESPAPAAAAPPPPAAPPPAEPELTRETVAARAPALLAALLAEGHAAGVAAERARLQAIDEIAARAPAVLVASAKYGAEPMSAADFAIAALRAPIDPGPAVLAARRSESAAVSSISPAAPDHSRAAAERAAAKQIATFANNRNGRSP